MFTADLQYETRICLFLDMLGFGARVEMSKTDKKQAALIHEAVSIIQSHFEKSGHDSRQVSQFSDSVVVSHRVEERSAVFHLLNDIGLCLIRLTELGFPLRGGLTLGHLIHTESHLFGPAMNEAYALESKVANYPRVIVQEDLLLAAAHAPSKIHSSKDEQQYVKNLLSRDFDGLLYIDYISFQPVVEVLGGTLKAYPKYLETVSAMILKGLSNKDSGIRAKYGWMSRHYMETKRLIEQTPIKGPFRNQNPGFVEKIIALPNFPQPGVL